jgi:dTDP-glucose pyrophosphorylase
MTTINKAVILARGLGTRMRRTDAAAQMDASQSAMADSGLKGMISVGRPFLDYVLSALADAGFMEACLVIGPEHAVVREHYEQLTSRRIQVRFAIQSAPRGTADALLSAGQFVSTDEFVVLNSDNYYPTPVLETLRTMDSPGAVMFDEESLVRNSNIPRERVRQFAYAEVDKDGYLVNLIEKPNKVVACALRTQALVSMNCWRFSPAILTLCRSVSISPRGEYELPTAVRTGIASGMRLRVVRSDAGVLDLSTRSDIAAVAKRLRAVEVSL